MTTDAFTEPVSETIAPGLRAGPIAAPTAAKAPTAQDHEVRSRDGGRQIGRDLVRDPEVSHSVDHNRVAIGRHHRVREPAGPDGAGDRGADQTEADEREAPDLSHGGAIRLP